MSVEHQRETKVGPPPDAAAPALGLFQVLRRYWKLILATALAATVLAAALALTREPSYSATAQLEFSAPGAELQIAGTPVVGSGDPARDIATNEVRVRSRSVAVLAARRLGERDVEAMRARVNVYPQGTSLVINVTATGSSAEQAIRTADAYVAAARDAQRSLQTRRARAVQARFETRLASLTARQRRGSLGDGLRERINQLATLAEFGSGSPRIIATAGTAARTDNPRQLIILGGLLGLALGGGLALLRARSDRRMHDDGELAATTGLPVLVTVPRSRSLRTDTPFPRLPQRDAEPFRLLFARLRFAPDAPRVVVVTSARDGEGKTTVALNLAAAAASSGERVLLVEGDLRAPTLVGRLGMAAGPGLADVLEGTAEPKEALQALELETGASNGHAAYRLEILPAGSASSQRSQVLLHTEAMRRLLRQVREAYDLVVIDTAPIGLVADAIPLLGEADGVILSTLLERSNSDATLRAGNQVTGLGGRLLGVVVNGGGASDAYPSIQRAGARVA